MATVREWSSDDSDDDDWGDDDGDDDDDVGTAADEDGPLSAEVVVAHVGRGSWGEVAQALEDGYAVNATNGYGDSILTAAARVGHLPTMALALARGASVNLQDVNGQTALLWAAFCGRFAALHLLLAAGADVNLATYDGRTPAIVLARHGRGREAGGEVAMCMKALLEVRELELGPSVTYEGSTVEQWAASRGHDVLVDMVQTEVCCVRDTASVCVSVRLCAGVRACGRACERTTAGQPVQAFV